MFKGSIERNIVHYDGIEKRDIQKDKMKRKSFVGKIVVLVLMIVSLLGDRVESTETERVTLRLWNIPGKYAWSTGNEAERAIFERFLELHPEIDVVSSTGITLAGQENIDSIIMAIAGGTAPDVIYVNFRKSTTYINQNFLYPLDEYVKEIEEDLKVKLHPKIWPIIKQRGLDGKEHIYAIPYGGTIVRGLWYRKDLFKKAGLNPDRPPKTWDEFYEYAMILTKPEQGQYGWATYPGMIAAFTFCNYIYMAGGEIVVQDEDGKWKAVYNSSSGIEALRFYHKLVRGRWKGEGKKYQGVVSRDMMDWHTGKVGMAFYTFAGDTLFESSLNPEVMGVAPLPSGPHGTRGAELNQRMFGISSAVKDKKIRNAAWEYIKFRASNEADRIMTKVYVESGEGRFVNPVHLKKFGYEDILKEVPQDWIRAHEEAGRYLNPEPYGKNCDMIYYELIAPVDNAWLFDNIDYKAVLDKAASHTTERLIGEVPFERMKKRRQIVGSILVILGVMLIFFFLRFIKLMLQEAQKTSVSFGNRGMFGSGWKLAWLFMLPALLTILIWQYYPLLRGLVMAFQDYLIMGESKFIGIDNFVNIFWEPMFWLALKNTFIYVFLTIAIGFFLPVILALMLNEIPRGTLLFRTLYYLPAITSPMVIMMLWKQFYDPSPAGLINGLLGVFGLPAQGWLQDPKWAMVCVILPGIWAGVGAGSMIYLAALKNVPEELYESAAIDGSTFFQKVHYITLPNLKVLLIINFVGVFIGSFRATENILMMTGGGPLHATHVIGLEIFYNAFTYLKFGYATAMAWILGTLLIGFTVYQLKVIRDLKFTTVE